MNEGIKSIQVLKDAADNHQAKKVVAIATAALDMLPTVKLLPMKLEKQPV